MNIESAIRKATSATPKAKSLLDSGGSEVVNKPYNPGMEPFTDKDNAKDVSFEVVSEAPSDGFGDDVTSSGEFNARPARKFTGDNLPALSSPLDTERDRRDLSKVFDPLRDALSPNLRSLSTVGIDALGGLDESRMREVLRRVLRTIKV